MLTKTSPATVSLAAFLLAFVCCLGTPALAAQPLVLAQIYLHDLGDEPAEGDDAAEPDQLLRPDTKPNHEGAEPPQSAEETKQNKLDLQSGEMPPTQPLDRPKMLAQLYEQLGKAKNASAAKPIMQAIEELWAVSGSDTVDLLMSRAAKFAKDADTDLSLAILDAVVDIAPQEAEVWHLRATVHVLKGEPARALSDLRRSLNLDAKNYRAINDLGIVLEQLGAKKEALEAYRRALAVNPFLDDARKAVEQLTRDVEGQDI
jgi:tetratricopeptide (TPR) repeat protein